MKIQPDTCMVFNVLLAAVAVCLTTSFPAQNIGDDVSEEETEAVRVGDMLFTPDQAMWLARHDQQEDTSRRQRRAASQVNFTSRRWPMPVSYLFANNTDETEKTMIREAIALWQAGGCVSFVELNESRPANETHNYVEFKTNQVAGCESYIGSINLYPQPIFLSPACFYAVGFIAHEIGHMLGLIHEQQRADRDLYISVQWDNLYNGSRNLFQIIPFDSYGLPYDYTSVMHYKNTVGSLLGEQFSMLTTDALYQQTIGQREAPSLFDLQVINTIYCPDACSSVPPACLHGGYPNSRNCNSCICPPGWTGDLCQSLATSMNESCGGGILTANASLQSISVPQPGALMYNTPSQCYWLIQGKPRERISLWFSGTFGVYAYSYLCIHWVEIRYKNLITGPRFCGRNTTTDVMTSTTNQVLVIFHAIDDLAPAAFKRGFTLVFQTVSVSTNKSTTVPPTTNVTEPLLGRNHMYNTTLTVALVTGLVGGVMLILLAVVAAKCCKRLSASASPTSAHPDKVFIYSNLAEDWRNDPY